MTERKDTTPRSNICFVIVLIVAQVQKKTEMSRVAVKKGLLGLVWSRASPLCC